MTMDSELGAGAVLGAYRIVRCIAIGGMGAVYEAEHTELRKRVALKTPHPPVGSSPEGRARFLQEGKTAAKICHPHVVDITDVGEVNDVAYLVMEYLDGEPLSALIEREAPLGTARVADIMVPVAAALHHAHGLGVIHRDLKPDNIFLTHSVQGKVHPKVLDFGVSKVLGDDLVPKLTAAKDILGTPQYLSPETLRDALAISDKSDQYSLGVVIYEASTGQNPFANHSSLVSILMSVDQGDYPKPTDVNRDVDARLEDVVLRAMSVSPGARFPSLAALGARLLPLASPDTRSAWAGYFAQGQGAADGGARIGSRLRWPRLSWAIAAGLGIVSGGAAATVATNAPRAPALRPVPPGAASKPSSAYHSPSRPQRPGEPVLRDAVAERPASVPPSSALEARARPAAPSPERPRAPQPRRTAPRAAEGAAPARTSAPSQAVRSAKTDDIDPWGS